MSRRHYADKRPDEFQRGDNILYSWNDRIWGPIHREGVESVAPGWGTDNRPSSGAREVGNIWNGKKRGAHTLRRGRVGGPWVGHRQQTQGCRDGSGEYLERTERWDPYAAKG